ncbi:MAG: DUF4846 domain-containing protein [Agriterribacter sp.]
MLLPLLFSHLMYVIFYTSQTNIHHVIANESNSIQVVNQIPLPHGFVRIPVAESSFAGWLRHIKLKASKTVYLYNGLPKQNQSAQFAVLDIPVGNKDLQQCADAVMRLRASYLFDQKKFTEIIFKDNAGKNYKYTAGDDAVAFQHYLEKVFAYCGTLSLNAQLKEVNNINDISAGDVFIKGGSPGHAVIVLDVAINKRGEKIYLIAQSYMPAQDIHILVNPVYAAISPWYRVNADKKIVTPEWVFNAAELKQW